MEPQTLHLHLSAAGGDQVEIRVKAAPFDSDAVVRVPRPRLGDLSAEGPGTPHAAQRDFHSAGELLDLDQDWERVGTVLFAAVFRGAVRRAYERARDSSRPLRLVLEFSSGEDRPGGLQALPWECLYDPDLDRFLAGNPPGSLIRFLPPRQGELQPASRLRLRVLVVASAAGPGPLDLDEELRRLGRALRWKWWLSVRVLRDPTPAELFDRVARGGFQVLHFMGHGGLHGGRGVLLLRDDSGRTVAVSAPEIAAGVQNAASGRTTLRLAVLNVCEGARHEHLRPFSAVATALVRGGVPAVIAMQQPIPDDDAISFSGSLYRRLVRGVPIDRAVAEARKRLRQRGGLWWAPVLYSHREDGRLFAPSAARRWLPRIGAGVLAAALLLFGGKALEAPEPARPANPDFPRSAENQDVRLTMPVPCKFLEDEPERAWRAVRAPLHCWFAVDVLGPFPTTLALGDATRFFDTTGREYFVQQAWLDGEPYPLGDRSRQQELALPIHRDATLELAFDASRRKQKARDLEVVLGTGETLRFGEFQLDRE